MKGWLIVNGFLHSAKFDELEQMFQKAAADREVELTTYQNSDLLVEAGADISRLDFLLKNKPDFVIFWDKDILLAEYLEAKGIRLYNKSHCIAVCDDKRRTHLALDRAGLPMPGTVLAPMTYSGIGFTDSGFLVEVERKFTYPIVVKEAFGSFGAQVYLVENRKQLKNLLSHCSATEILFQEFIESSYGRDIRLQVVGNKVVGSMYRYSEHDFRANITAGGHMKNYEPSEEECELAIRAARAVEADFAGVDLLFAKDGPLVCEVNSNAHFKNLLDCSGVNTAEEIIRYISEDAV